MLSKMQRYSTLGVQRWLSSACRPPMWRALLHEPASFLRHYVLKAWHAGRLGRIRHSRSELS